MKNERHGVSLRRIAVGVVMAVALPAHADLSILTGLDFTQGEYGATDETRILYVPLTAKFEADRYFARLTVPYISVDAPSGGEIIGIGADGQPIRSGTGQREKNAGLGDVVATAGYTVFDSGSGTLLDTIAKVKFGTADETKGLGTGETDYSLQLDGSATFNPLTLIATVGYRVYGDPEGIDFDDVFFGSLGGVFKLSQQTSAGLIYDTRQNIIPERDPQRELTAFVTHKISKDYKVQAYATGGFSDASPDWGAGAMVTFIY